MALPPTFKKPLAVWTAICISCVGAAEGLRRVAYLDPVGIPTYCFGETQHPSGRPVQLGDRATEEECKALLAERVSEFGEAVERCVKTPMSPARMAGLTSFTYNVGPNAFCSSTLVRKLNASDPKACDELLRWTKARGITLPGLVTRRQEERRLCLS